jgi:hypothetical protein
MSQNQIQNQRSVRTTTCSCCSQPGHNIKNCNSPQVQHFDEEAIATAIAAPSVLTLKYRRPFTNASVHVLKAIVATKRIVSSVSNLTVDYLTHLLACFYWNMHHPAGSHVNIRDSIRLAQLAQTCHQEATVAEREAGEAREAQLLAEARARRLQEHAAVAQRELSIFMEQEQRYRIQQVQLEVQRQHTRQLFVRARLAIPPCVSQPIANAVATAVIAPAETICLCCESTSHNISNCKNSYRGVPSMTKILALVSSKKGFRVRLQLHPNLYVHLAYAIQCKIVPSECRDCIFAMNKIADYFYQEEGYNRFRKNLNEYKDECEYLQLTGTPMETNVIHDPRVKFYQSILELKSKLYFNNMDNAEFVDKCILIADKIKDNLVTPIDVTFGFKPSTTFGAPTDNVKKDDDKEEDHEEDVQPCCVCLGAWDIQYPLISFGCNHEMCSRCVNTFFKTPTRPACHMCRQAVCHISVPAEALNEELFQDTRIRIIRETA